MTQSTTQAETCDTNNNSCCCSGSENSIEKDFKSHWDTAYDNSELDKLGWFEEIPGPSLKLLNKCELDKNARILNVGAGTTTLINELLTREFKNIIVNDISSSALSMLKMSIKKADQKNVQFILDDLTKPVALNNLEAVDLWHDRAVLHFFQDQKEQNIYFNLLKKLVKLNGCVIIAVFNLNGAEKCSGLPVFRYDEKMLEEKLGADFALTHSFNHTYHMPSGAPREYVYTLFKRNEISK